MENIVENFLKVSLDSNYGSGSGNGYGSGSGNGYGYGYGDGSGSGSGNGYGYGDVKALNGQPIYIIDGLPITLTAIHNHIAKGYIIKEDLTLKPCYIAKVGRYFAHGYSVKQALSDAQNKYLQCKPIEERLADFNAAFPDRDKKIPAKELYKWHNILTGSCEFGRREFCEDHKIDIDKDLLTVNEFIALTVNEYGGDIITQL